MQFRIPRSAYLLAEVCADALTFLIPIKASEAWVLAPRCVPMLKTSSMEIPLLLYSSATPEQSLSSAPSLAAFAAFSASRALCGGKHQEAEAADYGSIGLLPGILQRLSYPSGGLG